MQFFRDGPGRSFPSSASAGATDGGWRWSSPCRNGFALGLLPLPSRWIIEFGPPIPMDDYPEDAVDDAMLVFDLADRVRDTIQQMLYRNLQQRKGVFL